MIVLNYDKIKNIPGNKTKYALFRHLLHKVCFITKKERALLFPVWFLLN